MADLSPDEFAAAQRVLKRVCSSSDPVFSQKQCPKCLKVCPPVFRKGFQTGTYRCEVHGYWMIKLAEPGEIGKTREFLPCFIDIDDAANWGPHEGF